MSRILLIPCSHFNREGEVALRACYLVREKYPRRILIVTPATIGASSLLVSSFGVEPADQVAVNGCGLACVDAILRKECKVVLGTSIIFAERPSMDPRSALGITDKEVEDFAIKLGAQIGLPIGK